MSAADVAIRTWLLGKRYGGRAALTATSSACCATSGKTAAPAATSPSRVEPT
jgi:hypothetical protein